jgi:lysophospholipase L1-like esterase
MNYQNILCVGDSLTAGARSYGCYPLYLAKILSHETPYAWRAINLGSNGCTARDLWFTLNQKIDSIPDTYIACVVIGTNDISNQKDLDIFEEYYRQILRAFAIKNYKSVLCGEIPSIFCDGHIFFSSDTAKLRPAYNDKIMKVVGEFPIASFVEFNDLSRDCCEDSVHFNENGNMLVAESFARMILSL